MTPTTQFWTASERIDEIGKILKSSLDGHSRSTMIYYMIVMYGHQILKDEDLADFSEEVRVRIAGIRETRAQQGDGCDGEEPGS